MNKREAHLSEKPAAEQVREYLSQCIRAAAEERCRMLAALRPEQDGSQLTFYFNDGRVNFQLAESKAEKYETGETMTVFTMRKYRHGENDGHPVEEIIVECPAFESEMKFRVYVVQVFQQQEAKRRTSRAKQRRTPSSISQSRRQQDRPYGNFNDEPKTLANSYWPMNE